MAHAAALLIAALALGACSGSSALDKMNAPLRAHLDAGAEIECLAELAPNAPADARRQLAADGLTVRTVAGDVAVVAGPADAVRRAARHKWVVRLELSQERPPLSPGP